MVIKVIEWYETDRDKVKEAQKAIDDFSLSDSIDDLENAKEKESQLLQDSIDDWDDYLDMLESRYEEYDRLEQQKLLMEMLGVSSEEEVQDLIKSDMVDFTKYMDENMSSFFEDQITAFGNFNSTFGQFLDEYESNCERLYNAKTDALEAISADSYYSNNDSYLDTNGTGVQPNKKVDLSQSLSEIVENDKSSLKKTSTGYTLGGKSVVVDSNGYVDYSAQAQAALASGDYKSAAYDLALRQVKIDELGLSGNSNIKSNEELISELKKSGNYTTDQIESFEKSYINAQAVEAAVNKQNEKNGEQSLQIESETSQFVTAIATDLPTTLSENQAAELLEFVQSRNILSDTMSTTSTEATTTLANSIESQKAALVEKLTELCNIDKSTAQTAVNNAYSNNGGKSTLVSYYGGTVDSSDAVNSQANSAYGSGDGISVTYANGATGTVSYENGKVTGDVPSGTTVHTGGGDYVITGGSSGNYSAVQIKHSGMETGLLGGVPIDTSKEVIVKALKGEGVFTDDQMDAISNALGLLEDVPQINNPTYTSLYSLSRGTSLPIVSAADDILSYISTKRPEFESTISGSGDTIYDFGGITMNEVNSAEEFFKDLNSAMSNRHNITKNTRR